MNSANRSVNPTTDPKSLKDQLRIRQIAKINYLFQHACEVLRIHITQRAKLSGFCRQSVMSITAKGLSMPRVVLVNPLIPPNTGNIARTCAASCTELHLVGPLGFELSDRYLKRAGLDYWPHVPLTVHESIVQFQQLQATRGGRLIAFTTKGRCSYLDVHYQEDDWLLFGSETVGLPPEMVDRCDVLTRIPMLQPAVRSLNLSVSVAIALFEAKRQLGQLDEALSRGQTESI
jgi:tRNA (cytidine/uridine-2'-O-)-methyltransferase